MTQVAKSTVKLAPLQHSDVPQELVGWTVLEMSICPLNECLVLHRVKLTKVHKTKALAGLIDMEGRILAVGTQNHVEGMHKVGNPSRMGRTSLGQLGILTRKSGLARSFADTSENERILSELACNDGLEDYFKVVGFTAQGVRDVLERNARLLLAAIREERVEDVPGILKN